MCQLIRNAGLPALLLLGMAGCATTGSGIGTMRDADHEPVSFDWKSRDDVSGRMDATLADGRKFSGRYFQVTRDMRVDGLATLWDGWSPAWRGWTHWDWYTYPGADFVKYYSGRVLANLSTDDGIHMRCRFHLVHPSSGMGGGGQGVCQLPDGKPIDASFPNA